MNELIIRERDFASFFNAPFAAYGKDDKFISQMRMDLKRFLSIKNPLFSSNDDFTFFTALRGNIPVGRIVVHMHRASNEKFKLKRAAFGYFDVADDFAAANELLNAAEAWARSHGFNELMGNFNLTAMQQMGVMVGGYDNEPYTDFIWGGAHIPIFLERLGFAKEFPMNTFEVEVDKVDLNRLVSKKAKAIREDSSYSFVQLNKKDFLPALESIRLILNDGFSENPFFVPLTSAEMLFQAKDLSLILDERITALISHKGQPVGTIVCIPDLNPFFKATKSKISISTPYHYWRYKKTCNRAVLIFVSVNKPYQDSGLTSAMLAHIVEAMRASGYKNFGITWVWDENKPVHVLMDRLGAKKHHQLAMYKKTW